MSIKLDSTGLNEAAQGQWHYKIIVESNSLLFYNHLKQDNESQTHGRTKRDRY